MLMVKVDFSQLIIYVFVLSFVFMFFLLRSEVVMVFLFDFNTIIIVYVTSNLIKNVLGYC